MRGWLITLAVLALIVVGFIFVKGPQPVIEVAPEHVFDVGPLAVTNTMFTSWVVIVMILVTAFIVGRKASVVPSGFSGAAEALISGFYGIVVSIAGETNGRRFFPLVATIFFYIVISNYFGLLPINNVVGVPEAGHEGKQPVMQQTSIAGIDLAYIPFNPEEVNLRRGDHEVAPVEDGGSFPGVIAPLFRSAMTDVNAPLAIAIFSFMFVEFWGFQALGFGYLKKFFNFSRLLRGNPMGLVDVFVGLLELISEFIRMVSFTFRLFGNIFAGEVLLLMMVFLVPFVLVNIFYGLELLVGLIQAFVFAMLTLVFAQMAVSHHGDDQEQHGEAQG